MEIRRSFSADSLSALFFASELGTLNGDCCIYKTTSPAITQIVQYLRNYANV